MSIREYPDVQRPVVSVSISYRGAASDIVEKRVTQVRRRPDRGCIGNNQDQIGQLRRAQLAIIAIEFSRDRRYRLPPQTTYVTASHESLDMLPDEADPPEVSKQSVGSGSTMWLNVSSDTRSIMEVSDYVDRYLVDALSVVDGVAYVTGSGNRRPAMRIWVDPKRLAARNLTVTDIEDALRRENVQIPSGRLESSAREFTLRTDTGFRTVEDFERLVIARGSDDYPRSARRGRRSRAGTGKRPQLLPLQRPDRYRHGHRPADAGKYPAGQHGRQQNASRN